MKRIRTTNGLGIYGFKLGSILIGTLMMATLGLNAVGSTDGNASSLNWENYDEFGSGSLSSGKWDLWWGAGGRTPAVVNGALELAGSGNLNDPANSSVPEGLKDIPVGNLPSKHSMVLIEDEKIYGLEAEFMIPSGAADNTGLNFICFDFAADGSKKEFGPELEYRVDEGLAVEFAYEDPATGESKQISRPAAFDTYYKMSLIHTDSSNAMFLNGEKIVEFSSDGFDADVFGFAAFNDDGHPYSTYVKNVRVLRSGQGTGSEEDDEKEFSEFYKKLTEEVAQEENDSRASLLKGIHSLLQIFESDEVNGLKDFVVQLGVEPSIREFTLTDLPLEEDYTFELNRNFNSAKLAELFEDGIIPTLKETDAHFAGIPVTSVIILEPEFTGAEESISVDYADILVLRSMVKILSALASMQTAYDWGLNAGFVDDQGEENANSTMQTFRAHNPNLLGIRDKEQLAKARQFLEDGIALYQIASPILTHGSRLGYDDQPYPDRLFVIESDSLEDEREFREDLDDLLDALYEPYHLNSDDEGNSGTVSPQSGYHFEERDMDEHIGIIDLNSFFEGKVDLAQLLPDSTEDRFDTYQFKDPNFGGLFPSLNPKRLATILFEEDLVAGQKPHPHDTLSEALAHFDSDAYLSLNQDLRAQYETNASGALEHFNNFGFWEQRRYFLWPFETVNFPISRTEPTVVNGQVVLLDGSLLSTGGSSSVKVGFVISSDGLLPRYDLGWEVHQAALNPQNGFSLAYQPMKNNTTYYYRAYAENEAGRWFGSVKRFKSVGAQTDQNSLFGQALSLGNGWYQSPWFGILNLPARGWSYHLDLGWIYLQEPQDGLWIWTNLRQGWIWTRSDIWPHFWEHNQTSWLYFKKVGGQAHFFNFTSESYE